MCPPLDMASKGKSEQSRLVCIMLTNPSPINVGLTQKWDPSFGDFLKKAYTYHDKNLDHNSGQPLGISICQHSTYDGKRTTASTAHLADVPANLNIITNSAVTRILFEDRKAYGIEICGKKGKYW